MTQRANMTNTSQIPVTANTSAPVTPKHAPAAPRVSSAQNQPNSGTVAPTSANAEKPNSGSVAPTGAVENPQNG